MFERFLAYSLRHQKPVKVIWLSGSDIKTANLTVVALDADSFSYLSSRNRKQPQSLPLSAVLAAAYARGDDGSLDKSNPATPPE